MIIRVDQAGTDSMGITKVVLHSKAETVGWGYIPVNGTSAPQRLGVNVTDLAYETSRDLFVRYVNISSREDVIQVETGYIDKNTWLDWITYTASTNNMTQCVACFTACPTLFTVTAPLLFREDRPGFDSMLQLHMKEGMGHDCQILSALFPVVTKGVTPPLFSPLVRNYTCLTRKPRRCMVH